MYWLQLMFAYEDLIYLSSTGRVELFLAFGGGGLQKPWRWGQWCYIRFLSPSPSQTLWRCVQLSLFKTFIYWHRFYSSSPKKHFEGDLHPSSFLFSGIPVGGRQRGGNGKRALRQSNCNSIPFEWILGCHVHRERERAYAVSVWQLS